MNKRQRKKRARKAWHAFRREVLDSPVVQEILDSVGKQISLPPAISSKLSDIEPSITIWRTKP